MTDPRDHQAPRDEPDPHDQPDARDEPDALDVRAREAGRALRTLASASLDPSPGFAGGPSRVPQRRGRWAVASLTAALIVAAIVIGPTTRVPIVDDAPVTGPGDVDDPVAVADELPVPPVGEALPAYLADGTPVFVSHPVVGEVLVLDATTPHAGEELNWFCRTAGFFEEPSHSALFTGWGDYAGGPAPTALAAAPSVRVDEERVRVTGPLGPSPERDQRRFEAGSQRGPNCGDLRLPTTQFIVAHRPPEDPPHLDGTAVPSDRWVWTELSFGVVDGMQVVCRADGTCDEAAPRYRWWVGVDHAVPDPSEIHAARVWLARRMDDGTVKLLAPAHPDDRGPEAFARS